MGSHGKPWPPKERVSWRGWRQGQSLEMADSSLLLRSADLSRLDLGLLRQQWNTLRRCGNFTGNSSGPDQTSCRHSHITPLRISSPIVEIKQGRKLAATPSTGQLQLSPSRLHQRAGL